MESDSDSDWVQKADVQPDSDVDPDRIAVDETVVHVNGQRHWLFATVDLGTNLLRHVRLFQTRTAQLTALFLRERREKQQVSGVTVLVDDAAHLEAAFDRLGRRFRACRYGTPNAVERIFREVKNRTYMFSNTFSSAWLPTAES